MMADWGERVHRVLGPGPPGWQVTGTAPCDRARFGNIFQGGNFYIWIRTRK